MFNKGWLNKVAAGTQKPPKSWTWKDLYLCWENQSHEAPGSMDREAEGNGRRRQLYAYSHWAEAAHRFFPWASQALVLWIQPLNSINACLFMVLMKSSRSIPDA